MSFVSWSAGAADHAFCMRLSHKVKIWSTLQLYTLSKPVPTPQHFIATAIYIEVSLLERFIDKSYNSTFPRKDI